MKAAMEKALSYAQVDSTILIEGETGSGKELFAQSIHNASKRRYEPFIALNCAALPENLLESELMGYEEGAFTGARRGGKPGLLELADKGTIFLDEINQISPSIQAKLLRVLQEKQVLRLGGDRVIPVDIKIIAATNESLEGKVAKGCFREDLYYRLNVLNLPIPPVRQRRDDIPLLLEYFIKYFSQIHGPIKKMSDESLSLLTGYDWPGNVREIYNFVERYAVLGKNGVMPESSLVREYVCKNNILRKDPHQPEQGFLKIKLGTLRDMEKELLEKAVALFGGNKTQAALLLGISRTTLWKKNQK
jgi:transcriptional regulator with PAS, ATPase and Fis domain